MFELLFEFGWIIIILILWCFTRPFYWHSKNVPYVFPLPLFGNSISMLWTGMLEYYNWLYHSFDTPFAGFHLLTRPVLLIKDPKLIVEILVKNSDSFASHGMYVNSSRDPLGGSVFHLEGQQWKSTRAKITPNYTPLKIKEMINMAEDSIDSLIKRFNINEITEIKENFQLFTTQSTFTYLFGLEFNPEEIEMKRFSKELLADNSSLGVLLSLISPKLYDLFNWTSLSKWVNQYIKNLVETNSSLNQSNFIQKMKSEGADVNFIISQVLVLYLGGVETTSNTLSFCLYELATNQEVQERARTEAQESVESGYIEMVLMETLRKYPVFGLITRGCTKPFPIPDTDVIIEPGTLITIPLYSIHHDPKYFQFPEKFDPDRFADNKFQGSYLPFGLGPRTCIGARFAMNLMRECLCRILKSYRFERADNKVLKLDPHSFFTSFHDKIYIKFEKINI